MAVTPSETASASLTILLFGTMEVLVEQRPLPSLRSRKALWLLALLALRHGLPVEREWLAGTLWPDTDPTRAATNLRANLSELRRVLGAQSERLLSPNRHTLSLNLADAHVDVHIFDAAMLSKTPEALQQAVALYRGPLLADCTAEWAGQERSLRERACLLALQTLADTALAAGDHVGASDYYQRAARLDPLREAARRGWMEALARSGDFNGAMQVYREFAELLRRDPNAVPDQETSALYARLRAEARLLARPPVAEMPQAAVSEEAAEGKKATVPVVIGYLPQPLTGLVGREEECHEVEAKLRGSRLVTLTGPGGIGKTRLAIEVARESVQDGAAYPDGGWLVALEALSEGRLIVGQIASVLGLQEEPERSLLESLTDFLRSKRLLLALDNCEHLLETSAQISAHILRECAQVRILATSREALGITGETVWQVPALPAPDPANLPKDGEALLRALAGYESVQLFVERAEGVQKNFVLTGSNAFAVAQVCSQLEGIPLAVELAAARVKSLTVEQIALRLHDRLTLLTGGNRTAQSRQQTLRATLDWSYALLSEEERVLLHRLSVFAGGWTLEAAEQVGSGEGIGEGIEAEQVLERLVSLVDKSLVVFEERDGESGGRYRLLEPVRQYAAERLQADKEEEQSRTRHRDWFLLLAEEAMPHLRGGKQRHWLQRLDREYDNLRAALAWSEIDRREAEAELRLVGALWRFWYVRGNYSAGRQYLRNALDREDAQARTRARALALNGAGALAYDQGDSGAARALFEESLSISRQWEDKRSIAGALGNLANVALAVGEMASARALYEESVVLQRQLDDRAGIALQLSNLGIVLRQQGDYAAARNCFEESLIIVRSLDDRIGIARVLLNMGNLAWHHDDKVLERACFEESLEIFRELGDKQGVARSLGNLSKVLNDTGELETARTCAQESMRLFQELGDRRGIAQAYGNLGDIARSYSDYTLAHVLYTESLRLFQQLEGRLGGVESLEGLAVVLLTQADIRKSVQLWGAAETLRQTQGLALPDNKCKARDHSLAQARSLLGEAAFAAAWAEGSALPWEQAVASALTT